MENKKLIDLLKSNNYLFPSSEEEILEFERNNDIEGEEPSDWNDTSAIIKRGLVSVDNVKVSQFIENDIQDLKMAARKGEQSIPNHILAKMKSKHQNGNK